MATSSLMSKLLKKAGKDNKVSVLSSSTFFDKNTIFKSSVPIINLMISGSFDEGIRPGIHILCGDSRVFKCFSEETKLVLYVTDEVKKEYFS
jgi:hypothetical protein